MPNVRVTEVLELPGDVLAVHGFVDEVAVQAQGWVSWTQSFWTKDVPDAPRKKKRRKMKPEEVYDYCRDLLLEASAAKGVCPRGLDELLDTPPA